jgi:hypothetical protein
MTGTNCDLFTHKSSRSYLNHLEFTVVVRGPTTQLLLQPQIREKFALLLV